MKQIVWFNGRSKTGKTTLANELVGILRSTNRSVLCFDDDVSQCINGEFVVDGSEMIVISSMIADPQQVDDIRDRTLFVYLWTSHDVCKKRGCENNNQMISIDPFDIAIDTEYMSVQNSIDIVLKTLFKREDAYDVFRERAKI